LAFQAGHFRLAMFYASCSLPSLTNIMRNAGTKDRVRRILFADSYGNVVVFMRFETASAWAMQQWKGHGLQIRASGGLL
jgi:hypothetical protein